MNKKTDEHQAARSRSSAMVIGAQNSPGSCRADDPRGSSTVIGFQNNLDTRSLEQRLIGGE